jgi:hypothetical protein
MSKREVQYTMERPYFVWSTHKTLEAAKQSLEDDYACGDVAPCEVQDIARVKTPNGYRYEVRLLSGFGF